MQFAAWFIRNSPCILIIVLGVFVFFTAGAVMTIGWIGITMSLGFLTGVDTPSDHAADLNYIGMLGGWLTVLSGWLIIPTLVALLLGQGEKAAAEAEDEEYKAFTFATELGLTGKKRDEYVKRILDVIREL